MMTQGAYEELESAMLCVDALRVALDQSTPFDRPAILRALREACSALIECAEALTDCNNGVMYDRTD